MSRFRPSRGRLWGVFNTPLRPGTCDASKYRCNAPIGYVRFFEIPMRSPNWVRVRVQKMDLYTPPSVTYGGAYAIRPYNRVRAILRNTDAISRPGTCCPSKNCLVFVPYGAVCGAYAIRPYDRVRAALQKTVSFPSLSGPRDGRMRYAPTTGYVRSFGIPMRFSNRVRAILRNTDMISRPEGREFLGGGAVGATACGGDGRE